MMTLDRHHLPTDVPTLHGIILDLLGIVEEQRQTIARQQATIDQQGLIIAEQQVKIQQQSLIIAAQQVTIEAQQKTIEAQQQQITQLTQRVETLEKQLYGKRSERRSRTQSAVEPRSATPHGRRVLPSSLPRIREDHELSATEQVCSDCGGFLSKMGEVVSEQLDCVPSQLYVIQHARHKYACRHCQERIITAPMPAQPIDKGLAAPGLLAEVLVNKYQDALPLYRQVQRFKRAGLMINRSTLCDWVMQSASLLSPLVVWMADHHLKPSGHLHTDDTPIRMLQNLEGDQQKGTFWIYMHKGTESHPACTVYQFTPHRQGHAPRTFLQDFQGHLQADAYPGYDALYREKEGKTAITEVACWAHARRYFIESAVGTAPDNPVHEAIDLIGKLYGIEREARDRQLNAETLKQFRLERAPPLLKVIHQWLEDQKTKVLPQSSLAKAIHYALNHWEALQTYLQEGYLEIDNNRAERGIRPLVVGRKNYLFVGNKNGGEAAAVIYSLIETCKQHDVNPWTYFKNVLSRISTHPNSRIEELLPAIWKQRQTGLNQHLQIIPAQAA